MKSISFFSILAVFVIVSCGVPKDDRATSLCECWNQMHRIPQEQEDLMIYIADSCNTIYKNAIRDMEGNSEAKLKFDKAYKACQDE